MARVCLIVAALACVALSAAAVASASDPGRWTLSGVSTLPAAASAGLAYDDAGHTFLAGGTTLLRADYALAPELTLRGAIPRELVAGPGFGALGDPGWDAAGNMLVVPLTCAREGCGRGGLAAFDRGLGWRVGVTLDTADGPPGDWAAVSPDGTLVWTSAGADLLAYRTADLTLANATLTGAPIRAALRLGGAAPAGAVTGGAFWEGRLYLAAQDGGLLRLWSVDTADLAAGMRLEAERAVVGLAGGLEAGVVQGGVLHWLVSPLAGGGEPTYGRGRPVVLRFVSAGDGALTLRASRSALRAGRPALIGVRVTQTLRGANAPIAGALVQAPGAQARTDPDGRAELRVRPLRAGTLTVRATRGDLVAPAAVLNVLPPIGLPLSGLPSATLSAGGAGRRLRAAALLDCSGTTGCETPRSAPHPRGCVPARGGADVRVKLRRRPARFVDVLVADSGGRVVDGGRALAQGRNALGWRFPVRGHLPARGRLTVVVVYPDRTGALVLTRLGC